MNTEYLIAKDDFSRKVYIRTYQDNKVLNNQELSTVDFKKNQKYFITCKNEKTLKIICDNIEIEFSLYKNNIRNEYYENIFYKDIYNLKQERLDKLESLKKIKVFYNSMIGSFYLLK